MTEWKFAFYEATLTGGWPTPGVGQEKQIKEKVQALAEISVFDPYMVLGDFMQYLHRMFITNWEKPKMLEERCCNLFLNKGNACNSSSTGVINPVVTQCC